MEMGSHGTLVGAQCALTNTKEYVLHLCETPRDKVHIFDAPGIRGFMVDVTLVYWRQRGAFG